MVRHETIAWSGRLSICAAILGGAVCASSAPAALVGHWKLNESPGATVAVDSSASGFSGTLLGSAAFVPGGMSGNAIQLNNATNDLVDMGGVLGSLGTSCFTVSAWHKTTMTGAGLSVGVHISGIVAGYFIGLNVSGGCYGAPNKAYTYVSSGCGVPTSTLDVNDGAWHLITIVYSPGNFAAIYVDGAFQASTGAPVYTSSAAPFMLGGILVGATKTNFYTGLLDDVQVYSRALSGPQIAYLFQHPGQSLVDTCAADLNCTGTVDGLDLAMMLAQWTGAGAYRPCPPHAAADLNGDCKINGLDLAMLLASWGSCPAP